MSVQAARWFHTLLGLALEETGDVEEAVAAAELAFSLTGGVAGVQTVEHHLHSITPPVNLGDPALPPSDAQFGYVKGKGGIVWAGKTPPGDPSGWAPLPTGPKGGTFWKRTEGYQPQRGKGPKPAPKQPGAGQQGRPNHQQVTEDIRQMLQAHLSGQKPLNDEDIQSVAMTLQLMTVKDIHAVKEALKIKASGRKQQLAEKVAQRALAQVRGQLPEQQKDTPREAGVGPTPKTPKPPKPPKPQPPAQTPQKAQEPPASVEKPQAKSSDRTAKEKYLLGTGFEQSDLDEMDDKELNANWTARQPLAEEVAAKKDPSAALGDMAASSLQQWGDESKPLTERVHRLADLDTQIFDALYNSGYLKPEHGFSGNNELIRHLDIAISDWEKNSDKSQGSRDRAAKRVDAVERRIGEYSQALRKLAEQGVTAKGYTDTIGPEQMIAAADVYETEGRKAVELVRKQIGAAASAEKPQAPKSTVADLQRLTPLHATRPEKQKVNTKTGKTSSVPEVYYPDWAPGELREDLDSIDEMSEGGKRSFREEFLNLAKQFKEGEAVVEVVNRIGTPQEQPGDRDAVNDFIDKAEVNIEEFHELDYLQSRGHAPPAGMSAKERIAEKRRNTRKAFEKAGLPREKPQAPAKQEASAKVSFVPHPKSGAGEKMVMIDPAKFDKAWAKDESYYLPPGATGKSEVKGRREAFEQFLQSGQSVEAPRVAYGEGDSTEAPTIDDGRHRFAVLRDKGVKEVGVMVPAERAEEFEKMFGTKPQAPAKQEATGATREPSPESVSTVIAESLEELGFTEDDLKYDIPKKNVLKKLRERFPGASDDDLARHLPGYEPPKARPPKPGRAAERTGAPLSPENVKAAPKADPEAYRVGKNIGGAEHEVYYDAEENRYTKIPHERSFKAQGGMRGYAERINRANELWPELDYRVEAMTEGGVPVISMAPVEGDQPTDQEVEDWLKKNGWTPSKTELGEWGNKSGDAINDIAGENWRKLKDGRFVPVDVQLTRRGTAGAQPASKPQDTPLERDAKVKRLQEVSKKADELFKALHPEGGKPPPNAAQIGEELTALRAEQRQLDPDNTLLSQPEQPAVQKQQGSKVEPEAIMETLMAGDMGQVASIDHADFNDFKNDVLAGKYGTQAQKAADEAMGDWLSQGGKVSNKREIFAKWLSKMQKKTV